jgi:hypothetical protein
MKVLVISFLIASVGFCTPKCDEDGPSEFFTLPEDIEEIIPYSNEGEFILEHNLGTEITFEVLRDSTVDFNYCDHCCDTSYENKRIYISSDYPIFDIEINLIPYEESSYDYSITIGRDYFSLSDHENLQKFDSVHINGLYFQNVYKLQSSSYGDNPPEIDSLYYNFEAGIIKIIQQNGDTYEKL